MTWIAGCKNDRTVDGVFDGIFDNTLLGPKVGTIYDNPLGSNDETKIGALLGTSEGTEDGTADGLLGGYLDDILLGTELVTVDSDILASDDGLSLEPSLGLFTRTITCYCRMKR